jgi:hypothetical protein
MDDTFYYPAWLHFLIKNDDMKIREMCKKNQTGNLVSDADFLAHFALKLLP